MLGLQEAATELDLRSNTEFGHTDYCYYMLSGIEGAVQTWWTCITAQNTPCKSGQARRYQTGSLIEQAALHNESLNQKECRPSH